VSNEIPEKFEPFKKKIFAYIKETY